MSGLSLASHPPVGRAQAAHGANQGCLRAFVCLLLRARPCGGFALLCFLPVAHSATGPLLRSHLVRPHVTVWALLVFARVVAAWACCGRVCSVGGWGCVFASGACSCGCLRFLGVGALVGWWGAFVSRRPFCLGLLACLLACSRLWCGRCWRVRGLCVPDGRRGGQVGAGQRCPAPYCVALGCPAAAWRGEMGWGRVGCSQGVNTSAHTQRDGGWEGGGLVGRAVVAWAGAVGGSTRWWRQVPKAGGEQN